MVIFGDRTSMRETSLNMQNRNFTSQNHSISRRNSPSESANTVSSDLSSRFTAKLAPKVQPQLSNEELTRIFNTALVSQQAGTTRDVSGELYQLTEGPAFQAILNAVRQLAQVQGVPERQAAEQMIVTFKKMDTLWREYLTREGLERLRGSR